MTGNVGIVIQARVGSNRLPGKVLKAIEGKPLIQRLIERLKAFPEIPPIHFAIPDSSENLPIKKVGLETGVPVFTGPEEDVLLRYLQAAEQFGLSDIVRITADCPLLDPRLVVDLVREHLSGNSDLTANLTGVEGGFPRGMDVEVVKSTALHLLGGMAMEPMFREHVTLYFYDQPGQFKTKIVLPSWGQARPDLRLCVDEISDLELVKQVYRHFLPATDFSLVEIISFLDQHPEISRLNHDARQKAV